MSDENWKLMKSGKVIKIPSQLMPKRMSKKTMKVMHEKLFYIVKKPPNGKTTTMYHCYDMETRDFILCDHDKENLLSRLKQDYHKYKEKHNEH